MRRNCICIIGADGITGKMDLRGGGMVAASDPERVAQFDFIYLFIYYSINSLLII